MATPTLDELQKAITNQAHLKEYNKFLIKNQQPILVKSKKEVTLSGPNLLPIGKVKKDDYGIGFVDTDPFGDECLSVFYNGMIILTSYDEWEAV